MLFTVESLSSGQQAVASLKTCRCEIAQLLRLGG